MQFCRAADCAKLHFSSGEKGRKNLPGNLCDTGQFSGKPGVADTWGLVIRSKPLNWDIYIELSEHEIDACCLFVIAVAIFGLILCVVG